MNIEEAIEILMTKDSADLSNHFNNTKFFEAIETLLLAYEDKKQSNEAWMEMLDVFNEREYRKKYLEERRKEEPNLLYPDADEIYKRYYEQKKEIEEYKKDIHKEHELAYAQGIYDTTEYWTDKIKAEIEELDSIYQQEIKQQYNGRYYHQLSYAIQELQSLLEKE